MAELQRTTNPGIDISSPVTVLSYTYGGSRPLEGMARIDVGTDDRPIAGSGSYKMTVLLNDVVVSPDATVVVGPVAKTMLMSRALALDAGDVVTLRALGLPADTDVDVTASLRDVTGAKLTDVLGKGSTYIDHDYGSIDALRILLEDGGPVADAVIQAYLADDYSTGQRGVDFIVGMVRTGTDGRWLQPLMLDTGDYTLLVYKKGAIITRTYDLAVA